MNRKRKKQIVSTVVVFLFFLAGGIWYLFQKDAVSAPSENRTGLTGVFSMAEPEASKASGLEDTDGKKPGEQEQTEPEQWTVYVCGAVNQPGVYILSADSRLYEAVAMAGGFSKEADCSYHNLARTVADGERIYILSVEETSRLTMEQQVTGETEAAEQAGSSGNVLIDINAADREQLMELPGIGEAKASAILEYRRRVGRFTAIEEIMNVSGIGEAMFEKIKDKIMVKSN